ncbi:MAG TPA: GspH/FimT family pseudopilin [Burkholderiales bacterium]|nr:GspH/FimT family pseudopilin [Burkholderiales bacterium]
MREAARSVSKRALRGFTLIEIMVVIIIMGLFVGLVSNVIGPDDRSLLRLETQRLAQLLGLAATEARLTGKRIAWTADKSGYKFWRFSADEGWLEIHDVDSLRPRTLPQGMELTGMRVEDSLPQQDMRLEFNSSGPSLAFVIELTLGASRCSVEGSPIGDVRVIPENGKSNETAALPDRSGIHAL